MIRKCKVCGSEKFEFISEERVEEPEHHTWCMEKTVIFLISKRNFYNNLDLI